MFRLVTILVALGCCWGGELSTHARNKMIDGSAVTIEERPFQLAVMYLETYKCNAVIIGETWALTTASCATPPAGDEEELPFHVRSGSGRINTGGSLHGVDRIVIHDKYNTEYGVTPDFDIAVMRVGTPFVIDATTQVCRLWRDDFPPPDSLFEASGWNSNQLVKTQVQVIDQKYCIEAYAGVDGSNITFNMFCAEQVNEDAGPCDAVDVGSPITADGLLLGIVAHPTCSVDGLPTTYTSAVYLRLWIFLQTGISY